MKANLNVKGKLKALPRNIVGRIKALPHEMKELSKKKNFRLGTYTTATTAIVVAILLVINLCVSALPEKYTAFDTTTTGLYSISDETKELVGGLDEDVTIYYIIQDGDEDKTLVQLLENYKDLSSHIKVEQVDPVEQPNFASSYTSASVHTNSFIVVCADKSRYVDYYDIYQSSYSYSNSGYTVDTSFNGEGALTSAINYVTSDAKTTAYVLEGHGESSLSSGFSESIEAANINLITLNLLTEGDIPADCDCLIINGPTADLSKAESKILSAYLEAGGRLLLLTDCIDEELENLNGVMEEYGVTSVEGMIVEGNRNYFIQSYANYLLPEICTHDITEPLTSSGYFVLMPFAQGLAVDEDIASEAGADVSVLLQTSTSAYSKVSWQTAESSEMAADDIESEDGFPLGVAVTKAVEEDDESESGQETRIVWYTSSYLGNDQMNESVSGANYDLLMNSINWICEMEDSITIHAKSLSETYLTLTAAQSTRWSAVLVGLIPLAFVVAGIVMWRKRRKL